MKTKFILNITPQTYVRATQQDKVLFRIPENCPKECGLPRKSNGIKDGRCNHALSEEGLKRKTRLESYNNYKISVLGEAKAKNFIIPFQGASIKFFLPVHKSWSKKKKSYMHGKLHQTKPDLSNLLKALEDSLLSEDKMIAHYGELSKFWVDFECGWVEITVNEPIYDEIERPKVENILIDK